ncbi:MAG: TIGR03936 family radical SAM-associated protein, partial [Thermoanaerobaculales bacterium]|nr:TIGR03936 family radical SAM-associated protein [Thermoanaerobaculales bacterium]
IADCGVDLESELGGRELACTLPWDLIDAGVRKGYLKAEWRRALNEAATEDCKWGHCYRCGIPGDGADTRLATAALPVLDAPTSPVEAPAPAYRLRPEPQLPARRQGRPQPPVAHRWRFHFAKLGDARWLSHRQVMDALERVLRAAGLPVHYTEGFNPHIRLSMGPALAVGVEGAAEVFDVDCTAPITAAHLQRANALLPQGIQITGAQALLAGAPSLGRLVDAVRYRIPAPDDRDAWPGSPAGLDPELRTAVRGWSLAADGSLAVELNARQDAGATPSLKKLLEGLGLDEQRAQRVRAVRETLILRPRAATAEKNGCADEVAVS